MGLPYNVFIGAFLSKISEYEFCQMDDFAKDYIVTGYMKRACAQFNKVCKYDLGSFDDNLRELVVDIKDSDIDEIVDIVSEGMLVHWMKPYVYQQDNLQNVLNTRDFTSYSPAELLFRIRSAYTSAQRDFTNKMRDYSYDHGDLTDLHL